MNSSLSYNSLYVSTNDIFFDAEESHSNGNEDAVTVQNTRAASDSSSEAGSISSEEGSISSENSEETASDYNIQQHGKIFHWTDL